MKSPVLTDLIHNHTSIIETISGEITSSDWPDTQSYINYRDQIWWNHQFWPTWYTLYISELYRPYLVKSPVLTDLIHNHTWIIQTRSFEITSSDRPGTHYTYQNYTDHIWWNHQFHRPGTQSYISELYRTYLVKSPVLTDLIHNHTSIIETLSGEITSSDRPGTHYTYHNYTDHIWWNHQFSATWYTIIHIRIIQNISGEITSSDWPDTQSYINYRDHIWWNHQFWLTWYTIIHQL